MRTESELNVNADNAEIHSEFSFPSLKGELVFLMWHMQTDKSIGLIFPW